MSTEGPTSPTPEGEPLGPRTAAIIVSHNNEADLRRCLEALRAAAGMEPIEIVVVDAGSGDGCPRVDVDYPEITVLRLPRNFGKTRARNIGVRTATAEYVLFLDPRVELASTTPKLLADALDSRDELAAALPSFRTPSGAAVSASRALPDAAALAAGELAPAALPEACEEWALMIRRSILKGMNYLDEKRFSEYWAFLEVCWQVRNAGKKIAVIEGAQATLHEGTSVTVDETTYTADRVAGAAAWLGKHQGFAAGLGFRLKQALGALGQGKPGLMLAILLGRRVDPTQG